MTLEVERRGMIRPISDLPAAVTLVAPLVEIEDQGKFYKAAYGGGGGGGNAPDTFDAYTAVQFPFSSDFLDLKGNAAAPSSSSGASITGGKLVTAGGAGQGLQYANAGVGGALAEVLDFGSGNFTVEGWFQSLSTVALGVMMEKSNASFNGGSWGIFLNGDNVANSGRVAYWQSDFSGAAPVVLSPSGTKYNDGVRHAIRLCRNGNQFTLYVDGASVGRTTSAVALTDNTSDLRMGFSVIASRAMVCTFDNWRVLKGLAACAGVKYTVPTPPFPTT